MTVKISYYIAPFVSISFATVYKTVHSIISLKVVLYEPTLLESKAKILLAIVSISCLSVK